MINFSCYKPGAMLNPLDMSDFVLIWEAWILYWDSSVWCTGIHMASLLGTLCRYRSCTSWGNQINYIYIVIYIEIIIAYTA